MEILYITNRERNIERRSDFYENLYNNTANYTIQAEVEEGPILDNYIEHAMKNVKNGSGA